MKIFYSLTLLAVAFVFSACKAPEQPGDASEAIYQTPDRIENQRDVQQLHSDIQRQNF